MIEQGKEMHILLDKIRHISREITTLEAKYVNLLESNEKHQSEHLKLQRTKVTESFNPPPTVVYDITAPGDGMKEI